MENKIYDTASPETEVMYCFLQDGRGHLFDSCGEDCRIKSRGQSLLNIRFLRKRNRYGRYAFLCGEE